MKLFRIYSLVYMLQSDLHSFGLSDQMCLFIGTTFFCTYNHKNEKNSVAIEEVTTSDKNAGV